MTLSADSFSGGDCCDKHGGTINGGSGPMPTGGGCLNKISIGGANIGKLKKLHMRQAGGADQLSLALCLDLYYICLFFSTYWVMHINGWLPSYRHGADCFPCQTERVIAITSATAFRATLLVAVPIGAAIPPANGPLAAAAIFKPAMDAAWFLLGHA